jgi:hypothetical protein
LLVFQVALLAALILFSLLAYHASTTAYFPIDIAITHFVQSFDSPWVEALMRVVSWPGYSPQVILVVIGISALLFALGLRQEAALSALLGGTSLALNSLAKTIIERPRPSDEVVLVFRELLGFSFPSGMSCSTPPFSASVVSGLPAARPSWAHPAALAVGRACGAGRAFAYLPGFPLGQRCARRLSPGWPDPDRGNIHIFADKAEQIIQDTQSRKT